MTKNELILQIFQDMSHVFDIVMNEADQLANPRYIQAMQKYESKVEKLKHIIESGSSNG